MSFALTTDQVRARTKTVTRRIGWRFLKAGDLVRAVEKTQGLKKGERVRALAVLRVVDARDEPLTALVENPAYGHREVIAEGFPDLQPSQFVAFFVGSHAGATVHSVVRRIEFEYVHGVPPDWRVPRTQAAREIVRARA